MFLHRNASCAILMHPRLANGSPGGPHTRCRYSDNGVIYSESNKKRCDSRFRRPSCPGGATAAGKSKAGDDRKKVVHYRNGKPKETPLYSEVISCGDFVFVSGHGTNKVGGIREQTEFVLNEIDACLKAAGSSMAKAVKCNVYLSKLEDYKAMNEAYLGNLALSRRCARRLPLPAFRSMARWSRSKSWRRDD